MTAMQIAQLFNAKKTGKGRWIARCPIHNDHKPSLSIREGKVAVLIHCWSGCDRKSVLDAVGITFKSLWYADTSMTARELKQIESERHAEDEKEWQEKRFTRLQAMRRRGYGVNDMLRDWEAAVAVSVLMAQDRVTPYREQMLRVFMDNVISFQQGII